jgi:glycosyltransferase involved in cell wall biosynthesis
MTPTPLRILYIITKSNWGGAQRYVYDLAVAGHAAGHEITVAVGGSGLLVERLRAAGVMVRAIPSFDRDINLKKELSSWRELWEIIRDLKPDVVHVNSSKAGGSGAMISRLCGVPRIIFTAHGWPFYENRGVIWRSLVWFFSYLTTWFAHTVIVVSDHDRRGAHMPGTAHKIQRIYTAIPELPCLDRAAARAAIIPADIRERHHTDLWLVSTGEHTPNKNLGSLLTLLATARARGHTNLFLVFMSDGELRPELTALVATHHLEEAVYFTGFVPDARNYLKAFDLFLLPSKKEGFPFGLLEAGAAGLPVIASAVGGIPELIVNRETGLLCKPDQPDTLITALETYLADPALRERCAQALHETVRNRHQLAPFVAATFALYTRSATPSSLVS